MLPFKSDPPQQIPTVLVFGGGYDEDQDDMRDD